MTRVDPDFIPGDQTIAVTCMIRLGEVNRGARVSYLPTL
jgi:hypothetical protein